MEEAIIHRLSPELGGRSEVLAISLMEALGHMCMLKDKEEAKHKEDKMNRYLDFLARIHSHPPQSKEQAQARKEFDMKIKPAEIAKLQEPSKETDVELLRKIKEGG